MLRTVSELLPGDSVAWSGEARIAVSATEDPSCPGMFWVMLASPRMCLRLPGDEHVVAEGPASVAVMRADQVTAGYVVIEPVSQRRRRVEEVRHLGDMVLLLEGHEPSESRNHGFTCHRDQVLVAYHWTELLDEA